MANDIGFGSIDAKDSEVIDINGWHPRNMHNAKVMAEAEAEYLNGFLELQNRIKSKYEPQLIANRPVDGEPGKWDKGCPQDVHEELKEQLIDKRTDRLWYS